MKEITCFEIKKGYRIDEYGNIYSDLLYENHKMKLRKDKNGYLSTQLVCKDGVRRHFRVHRIVAQLFLPNPNNHPIVMHKDNNVENNHYTNLKWGTVQENTQSAYDDGLCSCNRKVSLYKDDVLITTFISASECERFFGFKRGNVTRILKLAESEKVIPRGRMKGYKLKFEIPCESVTTIRKE